MSEHLDPHSPEFVTGRDALFTRLRDAGPVAWSTAHGGFALVTRYEDVRRVLLDPETFSSAFPGRVAVPNTATGRAPLAPLEVDPPRHDQQVALVSRWFGGAVVDAHQDELAQVARDLLQDRASLEVVADLALPLVSHALALVLRLPVEDAGRWVDWAHRIFATRVSAPEQAAAAQAELSAYVAALLEDRRARPRDDVMTDLAVGLVDGAPLSHEEALGFGTTLLLAGRDATVDGLTTALVHLARDPADQQRLRADRSLLPRAVEELLRAYTPISHLGRVTTRDVDLGGTLLPTGTQVAVCYGSADRDPRVFDRAEQVVLDRRANRHLAFGHGVHRCLGAQVARLVLRTGIAAVLDGPDFALDLAHPLQDKPNGDTRGYLAAVLVACSSSAA